MYSRLKPKFNLASKVAAVTLGFVMPISIGVFNILLPVTILLSLLAGNFKEKLLSLRGNWVVLLGVLLFLLLILSGVYSTGSLYDIGLTSKKYSKLIYILFLTPLFMEARWQRYGINAFLLAMSVTLAASFLKMFGYLHIGNGGLGTLFTNHINTGFLMAFAAFIVAHRCIQTTERWRWWYIALFALLTFHIFFMNEGRTGYLIFMVLLPLFLWQKFRKKGLYYSALLMPLLLAALFLSSPHFRERIEMISHDMHHYQQQQLEGNSIGLRLDFFKHSLILIRNHPVIGTGIGSFRLEYESHFPPDPGFAGMRDPQNEYFMIAVQLGIIGLAVFLWIFYEMWRSSYYLSSELRNLAQGFVLAFLAGCWCDTFLYFAITGYFYVFFVALLFSHRNKNKLSSSKSIT